MRLRTGLADVAAHHATSSKQRSPSTEGPMVAQLIEGAARLPPQAFLILSALHIGIAATRYVGIIVRERSRRITLKEVIDRLADGGLVIHSHRSDRFMVIRPVTKRQEPRSTIRPVGTPATLPI